MVKEVGRGRAWEQMIKLAAAKLAEETQDYISLKVVPDLKI
jgi:hypothetical protein